MHESDWLWCYMQMSQRIDEYLQLAEDCVSELEASVTYRVLSGLISTKVMQLVMLQRITFALTS
jgi:hypothetical protein